MISQRNDLEDYSFLNSLNENTVVEVWGTSFTPDQLGELNEIHIVAGDERGPIGLNLTWPEGLTNLTKLDVIGYQLNDYSFLENLPSLTELGLHENNLRNLILPANLTNLTALNLSGNPLEDYSFINSLNVDTVIDLEFDSGPFTPNQLGELTRIDLSHKGLTKLTLPQGLTSLKTLLLEGNPLEDYSFIDSLNADTVITPMGNFIHPDQLGELTEIDLSWRGTSESLTLPQGLTSLKTLILEGNPLEDYSFINSLNCGYRHSPIGEHPSPPINSDN